MLPMFTAGPLVLDEHGSYWIIDSDLPGTSLTRSLNYAAVPPLSGWLQQLSLAVFGKSEFAFRLPSAVCHIAAVVVIYAFGTGLRDRLLGGLAAFVLAWHPESLDEVRIARCYGLVLLMSSLVVMSAWYWLRNLRSMNWAALWTLSAAGLLWTHYTSALLVVISAAWIGIAGLQSRARGRNFPVWLLSMIVLCLICLPLIPAVQRLSEWGPYLNYMAGDQPVWNFIGPAWWIGLPAGWIASRIVGGTAIRAGCETVRTLWSTIWILLGCSLVPLLLLVLLATGDLSSLANPRYRVAYVPAFACLAAIVVRRNADWRAATAGTVILLAAGWTMSPLPPWRPGRLGNTTAVDWRALNEYVAEHAHPGEAIFVQSGLVESRLVPLFVNDPLFLEYVACRVSRFYVESQHPRYGLPFVWDTGLGTRTDFQELIQNSQQPNRDFWIAAATDTDLNRESLEGMRHVTRTAGFVLSDQQDWPHATLERYSPAPTPAPTEAP